MRSVPFAFAVNFMLRECDVPVINIHSKVDGGLAKVLVRCPLLRTATKTEIRTVLTRTNRQDKTDPL